MHNLYLSHLVQIADGSCHAIVIKQNLDVVLCRRLSRLSGTFAMDHVVSTWPSAFSLCFCISKTINNIQILILLDVFNYSRF